MSYFDNLADKNEIVFCMMSELGWEIARWAAPVNQFIQRNPKRYIIATLPDRIDLYKGYHDFHPIHIDGLYVSKRPNMYKIDHMRPGEYEGIINGISSRYPNAFLCEPPKSGYGRYTFHNSELDLNFQPRPKNKEVIQSLLNGRLVITVASRHRKDNEWRNWKEEYWHRLFSMLSDYQVFTAGVGGGYVRGGICLEDYVVEGTSTIGLTIEAMRASKVTVGQQSGNPILSLLLGTPVISWGHEMQRHAVDENLLRTSCHFFDDPEYKVSPEEVFAKIKEMTK